MWRRPSAGARRPPARSRVSRAADHAGSRRTRACRRGSPLTVVEQAVAAIRAGELAILPTDTVYGLCAASSREDAGRALSRLKGRAETQPVALLAAGLDAVLAAVPELAGQPTAQAEALLPGPYTLVLPNPARRFAWLTGDRPDTIGVRVPDLPPDARAVLNQVDAVAATSANRHGRPDPARVEDIPAELVAGVAAVVDAGPLPGTPSTVLDLTGTEPAVLREGGGSLEDAFRRLRDVG